MLLRLKAFILFFLLCWYGIEVQGQNVSSKLSEAFRRFEGDPQMNAGIASLYVIEANSGKLVFEKNGGIGLAPASTQKVITGATAYELLGPSFRYTTQFGYSGILTNGHVNGSIIIKPSGDPTLGSWRWLVTKEEQVIQRLINAIKKAGITSYEGIIVDIKGWDSEAIPDGWIWQDIGNYYGAGAEALNWRENQFDVILQSGNKIGDPVEIKETKPKLYHYHLTSKLLSAGKGSGDNAFIYMPSTGSDGVIRGTIPIEEKQFTISGAIPSPRLQFAATLEEALKEEKIINQLPKNSIIQRGDFNTVFGNYKILHTESSPVLDSIVYWLNRKSVNLYGEALIKSIAHSKKQKGETYLGIEEVKSFWENKGIQVSELNMVDGSGLSPLNRITTKAQVSILLHARKQPWFKGFYHSFPEYNGMRMKSGTISGVKGFTGYHISKGGTEYIFSFLVNNFNGPSSSIVQKMYKVLDVLK